MRPFRNAFSNAKVFCAIEPKALAGTTPDVRVVVRAELREVAPGREDRVIAIPPDQRCVIADPERRLVVPPAETQRIGA